MSDLANLIERCKAAIWTIIALLITAIAVFKLGLALGAAGMMQ